MTPLLAAILTITGNIAYAIANVCSNAFLPSLAKEDEAVKIAWKEILSNEADDTIEEGEDETAGSIRILPERLEPIVCAISVYDLAEHPSIPQTPEARYTALLSQTTSRLSSIGTAIGFFSGVTVTALLLIPVMLIHGSTAGLKVAIALSGLWWGVFLIPAWLGLPGGEKDKEDCRGGPQWVSKGWKRVGGMVSVKEMRAIPNLYMFLLAWIFLSDGEVYLTILLGSTRLMIFQAFIPLHMLPYYTRPQHYICQLRKSSSLGS